MTIWISVKEKLPYIGDLILFCGIGEKLIPTQFGVYANKQFVAMMDDWQVFTNEITHWMRLPNPPKPIGEVFIIEHYEEACFGAGGGSSTPKLP